jgi:signal transduction histidine kinase
MASPFPQPFGQLFADLQARPIRSYRSLRYDGSAMDARLHDFPAADQTLLGRTYGALEATFALFRGNETLDEGLVAQLGQLYASTWKPLLPLMRALGESIPQQRRTERLRQIIHDLKGGAFQALMMYLQLIELGVVATDELRRIYFLARDQLKIMRNALPDIDPEGTARDAQQRLHAVELIAEKWQQSEHRLEARAATILVDCRYSGAVAERCLEFSALDRVVYNLVNNAVVHSAGGPVLLAITPVPADAPQQLRIAVANAVSAEQRGAVEARFPEGPGQLFQGGFTTGGSGLGMRICADFVCNAYGLDDVSQGLAEGHFGAAFVGDSFVAWVHWPIAAD